MKSDADVEEASARALDQMTFRRATVREPSTLKANAPQEVTLNGVLVRSFCGAMIVGERNRCCACSVPTMECHVCVRTQHGEGVALYRLLRNVPPDVDEHEPAAEEV